MRHLIDLLRAELRDRHLVRSDTGFPQDDPQQRDIGQRSADHTHTMSREIADLLDF